MKPEFLSRLRSEDLDSRRFRLLEPLGFRSKIFKGDIVVPAGFISDGTSDLLKDDTKTPAVVHDFLYQRHLVSKHKADRIFLEAMKAWKTPLIERWKKYIGVVVLGQSSYNSGPERFRIYNELEGK